MGITNTRSTLEKRYSALAGQLADHRHRIDLIKNGASLLAELEANVPRLEALVAAAGLLLSDAYPDWSSDQTPAKKPWEHGIPIPFGSCGRRARNLLRTSGRALTARQIANALLDEAGCPEPTPDVIRRTITAVEASLRKFKGRGIESSGKYPAQWRSTVSSTEPFAP